MSESTTENLEPTTDTPDAESFIVDEATDEVLRLNLDKFRGPFEVLLYLIRAQEVDIFDIPVSKITDQYLKVLDMIRAEELDVAGDFLVMAATLIQIKSKMIIPPTLEEDDEEIDEEDPRMELVEKLLEYRKYQEITRLLHDMEEQRAQWFTRNVKPKIEDDPDEEVFIEASLYDLIEAFKGVIRFITDDLEHAVENESTSVDEKIELIQGMLTQRDSVTWSDIFAGAQSKIGIICSFLAILELCRMGHVRAQQSSLYGEIRLFSAVKVNAA